MDRSRSRCVSTKRMHLEAVGILLALALLGCTAKPGACDSEQADEFVARLEAADPHARARMIEQGIDGICTAPTLFVEDHYHGSALTEVGQAAFDKACLAEPGVDVGLRQMYYPHPREDFYDACGFARFGVVSRSEYAWQPSSHPFVWTLHQWMLDHGSSADQARPITRAWLLRDRAEWADRVFERLDDLRLPAFDGERFSEGLVVQISPSEIEVDGMSVARLDDGGLDDDEFRALYDEMQKYVDLQEYLHERTGEIPPFTLVVAADLRVPRSMILDVIYWGSRMGYTRFATLGEPYPFAYTVQPYTGPIRRDDR